MILSWLSALALADPVAGPSTPTFNRDVAPIIYSRCTNCHRAEGLAPKIPLVSYESVRTAAKALRAAVQSRAMPPWPADSAHSLPIRNDPTLSPAQIATVLAWVDAGAPRGDGKESMSPPAAPKAWSHPLGIPPDAVVSMPDIDIAANGTVPYIAHQIKVPFHEDKWIAAMQARPSNIALVHHMGITEVTRAPTVKDLDVSQLAALARQMGLPEDALAPPQPAIVDPTNPEAYDMLGIYTPGTTIEVYDDDSGKLLKGGDNLYINFNVHYTTTGRPERDRSQLAFGFVMTLPRHELLRVPAPGRTIIANGRELLTDDPGTKAEGTDFAIPPVPKYSADYELIGLTAFAQPVTIYQLQPHAHMRGKDFTYSIVYPDGHERVLLSVPHFDFHWQFAYQLANALTVPAGSKLVVKAHYDNSASNAHLLENQAEDPAGNCGPDKLAYFRAQNQSWDEMFSPMVQYSIDAGPAKAARTSASPPPAQSSVAQSTAAAPARRPLPVTEIVGCLSGAGPSNWVITHASAADTASQSTSAAELKQLVTRKLGDQRFALIGAGMFATIGHDGQKIAAKGIIVTRSNERALNVTSLQPVEGRCE